MVLGVILFIGLLVIVSCIVKPIVARINPSLLVDPNEWHGPHESKLGINFGDDSEEDLLIPKRTKGNRMHADEELEPA